MEKVNGDYMSNKESNTATYQVGGGSPDEYLTGISMRDAQKAQTARKKGSKSKPKSALVANVMSSLVIGISNVPDSLATSMMVGVNPIFGLYATTVGPTVGGLISSSQLMMVGVTVPTAMLAGEAIASIPEPQKLPSLFAIVLMAGLFLVIFGFLKFGRLRKYISYAVMRGFLYGVGVLLLLSQSPPLFGYEAEGSNAIMTFVDTITHISEWNVEAVFIGALTLAAIIFLRRTILKSFSSVLALLLGSLLVYFGGFESVNIVQDISSIPSGLPQLSIPSISIFTPQLVFTAFSMAVIIGIQGLGLSQMAENPDGSPVNASRDMIAQGAANVATGLLSGIPVGGSVGSTALNMTLGAKSRLAAILTGFWMLAIVLLFSSFVEQIPMPSLTALIMMAGIGAVNVKDAISILRSGWSSILSFTVTMLCILLFSIPIAVAVGVVLAIVMHFIQSANDITVVQLIKNDQGLLVVNSLPEVIPEGIPMLVSVEGSLFFAGAQTLLDKLPKVGNARNPVVILRLRSQSQMGATLIDVLDEYAEDLEQAGGKLYLTGLDSDQLGYLEASGKLDEGSEVEYFVGSEVLRESMEKAYAHAEAWIKEREHPRMID
ncbi:MAG: SulP family inorganic anion transporter [Dethiosulfatibacter sp.]|nr:SulP family inorganic anion transporter [Dethiosulfatibacter sp.]